MKKGYIMDANIILESFYYLAKHSSSPIDKLSAMKLLFFADRYHLRKYGRLISEDTYYALPHGPVASNALNILNDVLSGDNVGVKKQYIKGVTNQSFVPVDSEYELEYISDSDIEALDFAIKEFGHKEAWDLRNITHEYPEWKRFEHTLENQLSRREKILMDDFFAKADSPLDPFSIIPDRIVELSKEVYFS